MRALLALACAVARSALAWASCWSSFGRGDHGQQRALLHFGADVEVPAGQVAGGARIDGRIRVGGHVAGQHEAVHGRAWLGGATVTVGAASSLRALGQHRVGMDAAQNAEARQRDGEDQQRGLRRSRALRGEMGFCSGAFS